MTKFCSKRGTSLEIFLSPRQMCKVFGPWNRALIWDFFDSTDQMTTWFSRTAQKTHRLCKRIYFFFDENFFSLTLFSKTHSKTKKSRKKNYEKIFS